MHDGLLRSIKRNIGFMGIMLDYEFFCKFLYSIQFPHGKQINIIIPVDISENLFALNPIIIQSFHSNI